MVARQGKRCLLVRVGGKDRRAEAFHSVATLARPPLPRARELARVHILVTLRAAAETRDRKPGTPHRPLLGSVTSFADNRRMLAL